MMWWRPAVAGWGAICASIGLARFAYVPLFPAMVAAGWVDGGGGGLLGAANLAGYLGGVMAGRGLARRLGVPRPLDAGMALAALSFAACAFQGGLAWFCLWRALAGVAGGFLMALSGPSVQASVPPEARGLAGGVVMAGAGTGVMLAGLLVPLLLGGGLALAWLGLSLAVLAIWLVVRPWWPDPAAVPAPAEGEAVPRALRLLLAYGLSGAGMVAPMVYLADLAVRGRGLAVTAGSLVWVLFGAGAMAGTLLGGRIAGRIGGRRALPAWMVVQVAALSAALVPWWPALLLAAPLGGFAGVGATAVTLVAAREVAGVQASVVWVRATAGYAIAQAGTAFALAAVFAATGDSHAAVFAAGLALSAAALVVAWHGRAG
ncbi:YbfB/YjiJ family MFS transporter [Roseomonas stagni]|uniref:YbfB/YjiJ family MFS transporter n=1 Tax=Falsiroseomonas algicola TaxID=2716930 RepID=A0A6M1LR88_9PROT|nr:YbfB/YjiJ family MFS transporter [Falsiroseomonas algicola]NGM22951.1 YbfB/YjiJ family MFS transporter [Falsiroseomonas algicola]